MSSVQFCEVKFLNVCHSWQIQQITNRYFFFLIFPENRIWHFIHLHEMSKSVLLCCAPSSSWNGFYIPDKGQILSSQSRTLFKRETKTMLKDLPPPPSPECISIPLKLTLCNAYWVKISADDILKYFFLLFLENRIWHSMQIVSLVENLHEVSDPIF